jgi:branched-chain amino acid transport system substrate-binding protein
MGGVSRRAFIGGVAGAAVVAGVGGYAGGFFGTPRETPQTVTGPTVGATLVIGSGFPETGLVAADGLSGLKSLRLGLEEWVAIWGALPNDRPDWRIVNVDSESKFAAESASAVIRRLATVENVDYILTDYITVDASEYEEATQHDLWYINHDVTGLAEQKVLNAQGPDIRSGGWHNYTPGSGVGATAYPDYKYWNCIQAVPPETDYGKNFVSLVSGWEDAGKWKPINRKYAMFEGAGSYGERIAQLIRTCLTEIGWTESIREFVEYGLVDWGPQLAKVRADPPAFIFNTDFIPSDHANLAKQFQEDPTPSLLFHQYGMSIPDFMPLAGEASEGLLFHECRGLLHDDAGYNFEERYWRRYGEPPALADSAQSLDFLWVTHMVGSMAGGWRADQARRMVAIVNSGVSFDRSDFMWRGLGGAWSLKPGQVLRAWSMEEHALSQPMGGPVVTYQVKRRAGEGLVGSRIARRTEPGNIMTRVLIGAERTSEFFHTNGTAGETNTPYFSPIARKMMAPQPDVFFVSGQFPLTTDGVKPSWADETLEIPEYFERVRPEILNRVTQ